MVAAPISSLAGQELGRGRRFVSGMGRRRPGMAVVADGRRRRWDGRQWRPAFFHFIFFIFLLG
jgi:hypothetical protein